jgi:hypothetical protein
MIIAQRNLTIKSSGKNIEVPVRIFAPVHSDNTYTCTYEIGWPTGVKTMTVSGTDSVQAIEIALQFIGISLYTSPYHTAGQLSCDGMKGGYGFPVPSNARDMLVGEDAMFF